MANQTRGLVKSDWMGKGPWVGPRWKTNEFPEPWFQRAWLEQVPHGAGSPHEAQMVLEAYPGNHTHREPGQAGNRIETR